MSTAFLDNLIRFEEALHAAGLSGSSGRILDAVTAVEVIGVARRDDVRAALAAVFVDRRNDLALFHRVFDLFWRVRTLDTLGGAGSDDRRQGPHGTTAVELEYQDDETDTAERVEASAGVYAWEGVPRHKDFADFTSDELARAQALFDRLDWQLGVRRARRWRSASTGAIDLRRVLAHNRAYGGELLNLPRRRRVIKPRPLVVLADVSGSMERYSRVLLQFVYALTRGAHRVESFVFATRLTRITRTAVDHRARSVDHLVRSVQDWGGGTRIGAALRDFNVTWARRVIRNGPIVLLISDGWDRGEPTELTRELVRVRRSCTRLIWLNPLLGSADYEPLTRGMKAALPLVDDFLPVHNLASLEALARHVGSLARGGRAGGARERARA